MEVVSYLYEKYKKIVDHRSGNHKKSFKTKTIVFTGVLAAPVFHPLAKVILANDLSLRHQYQVEFGWRHMV